MLERRRHQRIRFSIPPKALIGYGGEIGEAVIENLSLSGLMMRTTMPLEIGRHVGCEFRVFESPMIDVAASVVTRVGDMFGVRFQPGPINEVVIDDAIHSALDLGQASILTMHESAGRKVMRIVGGLDGSLRGDFMHCLTRVGVDEIDLSGVTAVESGGMALCLLANGRYGVAIGASSPVFADAWQRAVAIPAQDHDPL